MSYFSWDPAWETGIERIDHQHKSLFNQADCMFIAIKAKDAGSRLPDMMLFLVTYVDSHFRDEEAAMEATQYPRLASHRAIHDGMREKVGDLVALMKVDPAVITEAVLEFLVDWLVNHMQEEDRVMAIHLRESGVPLAFTGDSLP